MQSRPGKRVSYFSLSKFLLGRPIIQDIQLLWHLDACCRNSNRRDLKRFAKNSAVINYYTQKDLKGKMTLLVCHVRIIFLLTVFLIWEASSAGYLQSQRHIVAAAALGERSMFQKRNENGGSLDTTELLPG